MSDVDPALTELEAEYPDGIEFANLLAPQICNNYLGDDEDGEEMICHNECDANQQRCYMCLP
jgi:hypothetical protein